MQLALMLLARLPWRAAQDGIAMVPVTRADIRQHKLVKLAELAPLLCKRKQWASFYNKENLILLEDLRLLETRVKTITLDNHQLTYI